MRYINRQINTQAYPKGMRACLDMRNRAQIAYQMSDNLFAEANIALENSDDHKFIRLLSLAAQALTIAERFCARYERLHNNFLRRRNVTQGQTRL